MLYISNFKTIKIEYYALLFLGFTLFCFIMVPPDVSKHKAYSVGELIPYKYGDDSEDSQYRFYVKKEDFISSSFSGKINEIPYLNKNSTQKFIIEFQYNRPQNSTLLLDYPIDSILNEQPENGYNSLEEILKDVRLKKTE
jgi:hypothetical protein